MREDEYDELIKNPVDFMLNTLAPRKFKKLNGTEEEVYEALKKALIAYKKFVDTNKKTIQVQTEKYGIISSIGSKAYAPLDVVFDRLRGFRGTLIDLKRNPKPVIAAAEALYPLYIPLTGGKGNFPFAASTIHSVSYLGPKLFGEAFWPTYKRMLLEVYEKGSKTLVVMEGNWTSYYSFIKELPDASIIMNLEEDDPFVVKKELGKKGAIAAAVPVRMLRYKSKQECLDYAKKLIDECAYDGGLIFMTDLSLLSESDVNIDNLIAVNQFVHEYGKL
jgi:hypothetical protein